MVKKERNDNMKKTILIGLTASMLCSMNFVSAANNQNIKTKVYDVKSYALGG